MGTTGLETAFAAVYTELVLPGVLPLALVVEKLSAGAALLGPAAAADRGRRARPTSASSTSRRSGRSARPATRAARRTAASPGARCAARCSRRSPPARVAYRERAFAAGRRVTRLRPARGRRRASTATPSGRARPGDRRGRLHDRHVGLPGVDDRPELRAPAHHLHVPARRQLRRQRGGDGVRPHPRRARRSCARRSTRRTRPAPSRAGSTGCATTASRASPASTRARSSATSATAGAMRGGDLPRRDARGRGARARSPPSRAWSAATSRAR